MSKNTKTLFRGSENIWFSGDDISLSTELIQHLASRGARKFVLVTKNKLLSGYQTIVFNRLKNKKVSIVVSISDPLTVKGAEDIFREALVLGPISGIFFISTVSNEKI